MRFKKVYIEITNVCNLKCSFCIQNKRVQAYMKEEEFVHILKQLQPYTTYIYLHVLGEPLLHPQLSRFLALAKQYHMLVNITTNATLLSKQVDVLVGNIRQLNMSLHSFPEQTGIHNKQYIEECMKYGDVLANHGTYVSYRLWNMKQGKINCESMQIIKQLEAHYHVNITIGERIRLEEHRFLHFEEEFVWPSIQQPIISEKGTCYGLRSMCAILVDGSVVPCCLDAQGACILGNIYQSSLASILESKKAISMVKALQENIVREELCQRCGYRTRFD